MGTVILAATSLGAVGALATVAEAATSGAVTGYQGLCLDDFTGSNANGTKADLYGCNSTPAQQWTIASNGTLQINGKCLDITGGSTANGALVELWDCNGGANQVWQQGANNSLVNPASGKCLDDPGFSTTPGTQLDLWDCNGGANQAWALPGGTTSPPPPGNGKHLVTGYWQDFDNGATDQKISDVNSAYDIIAVSFATADPSSTGGITFSLDPTLQSKLGGYTDAQFKADIAAKHAAGKKVVLSVGGQNGTISVASSAAATNFANSAYALMQTYGFDGVDIDLENGLNPTYMAQALHSLASKAGSGFVLTMAPQTIDMLTASSDYLATALAVKDVLTIVNTQYYNSGSMNGCDGGVYSQGSVDFITSMVCTAIQAGLKPAQVGIGVPASSSAAGSGYVAPSVVENALNCIAKGTNCGTYKPTTLWPSIGGVMTWSTAWDAKNGNQFALNEGAFVHAMP
ncbi:chitinase [Streptacidiphilus sp. PAMC 29251]